jgi:putative transposase
MLPAEKPGGRPRERCLRNVLDGIFYLIKTGCQWRLLPCEFQPWSTVYGYFRTWAEAGIWDKLTEFLRSIIRLREGRNIIPTAGIIDSQTVKSSCQAIDDVGYNGGKKMKGRNRHLLVDTLGLPLKLVIQPASTQDRDGCADIFTNLRDKHPIIQTIFADGGYRGPRAQTAAGTIDLEIVKRDTEGFSVVKKRWIVERTFAWLVGNRRLRVDYEGYAATSAALIEMALIRLMMRRIWP